MKLFRVTLKGMTSNYSGTIYGIPYVIANDPTEAYEKVKTYLDEKVLGYSKDRVLNKVELLAETGDFPECKIQLFL